MNLYFSACLLLVSLGLDAQEKASAPPAAAHDYLPLTVGLKWVLKNPKLETPAVFEVLERDGEGFRIRSSHPWGSSEWTLEMQDARFVMVAYGTGGSMMPLPKRPLYLNFPGGFGAKWSNSLGSFRIDAEPVVVQVGADTYRDCIRVRHKAGRADLVFTFAPGIGYVQFGEGKAAFVLDKASSRLPGALEAADQPGNAPPTLEPPAAMVLRHREPSRDRRAVLFGLTPNRFANEPLNLDVMTKRFDQTVDAGVSFFAANGKWAELEPRDGQYNLTSVNQLISVVTPAKLPISYTLNVIYNIVRDVPPDLQKASWADPRMRARVLRLIEQLAPLLRGRARWFMFGYEIDGYFEKHPDEVKDFIALQQLATARMKELAPDIQASTTLTYGGLGELTDRFAALDNQMDFLTLTYCPLNPGFTVRDPSVLPSDFSRMKRFARDRKIVLQEIAYPSSAAAGSNEDKQAEFFRLAFQELERDPGPFAAVNIMTLADLSNEATDYFSGSHGLKEHGAFRGVLQTLGLFDGNGRPKKAWDVVRRGMQY